MWHLNQLGLESGKVVTRGSAGGGGVGRELVKGYKLTVRRGMGPGDLTHRPAANSQPRCVKLFNIVKR